MRNATRKPWELTTPIYSHAYLTRGLGDKMDSWRWLEEGNDIPASLSTAVRSLLDLGTPPGPSRRVLDFDLQSWPPSCPDWWIEPPLTAAYPSREAAPVMNENVLYQPCITSWSIVLSHPTNLSLSQRLINHGHDSVSNYDLIANQSTSRWRRT